MNDKRRAGLEALSGLLSATQAQLEALLADEREEAKDLPDDVEYSEFADRITKRPMFELSAARIHLIEAVEHIGQAIKKAE